MARRPLVVAVMAAILGLVGQLPGSATAQDRGHHDDALHAIGQCPNGPNCPRPVRPSPKPSPVPTPAPEPVPTPDRNPNVLGLSDEEWQAVAVAVALLGGAVVYLVIRDRRTDG